MERELCVTISVLSEDRIFVSIDDYDSGDHVTKRVDYSPKQHTEFDEWIGGEIYDWINFMMEGIEDEC